jgi:hypothetical protein
MVVEPTEVKITLLGWLWADETWGSDHLGRSTCSCSCRSPPADHLGCGTLAGAGQRVPHGRRAHHVARRKLRHSRGRTLRHESARGSLSSSPPCTTPRSGRPPWAASCRPFLTYVRVHPRAHRKKCCLVSEKDDLNLVVLGVCSRVRADVYQHRLAAQLRLQLRLRRHAGTPELARYVRRRRAAALVPRRGRGAGN